MNKRYLLCVGTSDSHQGAINFICEKLKKDPELSVELFTVVQEEQETGMFSSSEDSDAVKAVKKILEQNKVGLGERITNKVLTSYCISTLSEGLKNKLGGDNDIIAIVLGMSNISQKKQTILKLIEEKKDILYNTPIIIIPESITIEQIMNLL